MQLSSLRPSAIALGLGVTLTLHGPRTLQAEDAGASEAGRVQLLVRNDGGGVRAVDTAPPGRGIVGIMGAAIEAEDAPSGAPSGASSAARSQPAGEPAPYRYQATSWSAALKLWKVTPAQRALLRGHADIAAKRAPKPTMLTLAGVQSWLTDPLTRWFDARRARLAQADEAARARGLDPQLLAAAHATIADDTAAVYLAVPTPKEIASSLALIVMLRGGAASSGDRVLEALGAIDGYEHCSTGPSPHVAAFCQQRREVLRDTFKR